MEHNSLNACIEEWETLSHEYSALEKTHEDYQKKLEDVYQIQQKCIKGIAHQRYRINIIKHSMNKLDIHDADNHERYNMLNTDFLRRKAQLYQMESILPKPNGLYLKIIVGNINVSILDKNEKHRYKDEYEKFKLVMSLLAFALSVLNLLTNFRPLDLIHSFLLVWYYCTLTIRESILKVNGSRMKGWWRLHHFISTVLAGIILIWPNGEAYYAFRWQFFAFNTYISFVQYLQFMYQKGCLYRLKALGERDNMDITIEGFNSWMWRGLGFVLPFLYVGYFWELYNAYTLYHLSFMETAEWHVYAIAILFFILFLGNALTTTMVIPEKIKERLKLKYRFTRLDKHFWTHRKRRVSFRNIELPKSRSVKVSGKDSQSDDGRMTPTIAEILKDDDENCEEEVLKEVNDVSHDVDFAKVDQENEEDGAKVVFVEEEEVRQRVKKELEEDALPDGAESQNVEEKKEI